jgi:hypothetical protein
MSMNEKQGDCKDNLKNRDVKEKRSTRNRRIKRVQHKDAEK